MPTAFYNLPREIRDEIFDKVWRSSPVPSFDCVPGVARVVAHGHSSSKTTNWPGFTKHQRYFGLPQWLLASKGFWNEGIESLRRCPTELHLHDDSDDFFRVPKSSSELWYQLATQLNVYVRLDTGVSWSETTERSISSQHAQYLTSLASTLAAKGRTKHLKVTLQESFILTMGTSDRMIWSGIMMPRAACLYSLYKLSALMPQLQVFEIVFREALEAQIDDPEFVVARQEFHDSLRDSIETLGLILARGMSLETKRVGLNARHDFPGAGVTHTDWCFIFRRK